MAATALSGRTGHGAQVGLLVASAVVPGTFARSLSARSWLDQGIITGLSAGTTYLVTVTAQELVEALASTVAPGPHGAAEPTRWERAATLGLDLAAIPAGFAVGRLLPERPFETVWRGFARQLGWRFAVTGLGASVFAGVRLGAGLVDERLGRRVVTRLPLAIPAGVAVALVVERARSTEDASDPALPDGGEADQLTANPLLGLAAAGGIVVALAGAAELEHVVSLGAGRLASSALPGSERTWRLVGHAAALGAAGAGLSVLWGRAMRGIEAGATTLEPLLAEEAGQALTTAAVSGSPQSLVSWDSLGREGRRHVAFRVRPEPLPARPAGLPDLSIPAVMGQPAKADPVQVYVGLDAAKQPEDRVRLALAEMDRTGAWDRSLLMLCSPTGSGYVNYVATATVEYLTLGDVATVTLQYSKRPSPLSLTKVAQAREQNRLLWLSILQRVRAMPAKQRPRVVLFGESLGAFTSQDVLMHWGTLGPQALGIDRALWIGTPYFSKWKEQVNGRPRPDVDRDVVATLNDFGQLATMDPRRHKKLRYVMLSHDNDGVTKFGTDLLAHAPDWLGPERPPVESAPPYSPRGISRAMRWRPVVTFFQTFVDMKNAQVPGPYRAFGHDYRPDLPAFLREVFALPGTDDDLARVAAAVEQRETLREGLLRQEASGGE